MTDDAPEGSRKRVDEDFGPSQGDAVSNPFDLTIVCLKLRLDPVEADDVTCHADELEENFSVVVRADVLVRRASTDGVARAAHNGHEDLAAKLKESLADYLADRVVSAWQIGPATGGLAQAADEVSAAADLICESVRVPLEEAETAAGVPECPAGTGAGVIAAFVTGPMTRPISEAGTLIDIAGVIIGIVANMHPLALACANRLAKKKITDYVAKRIAEVLDPPADPVTAATAPAEEAAASQLHPRGPVCAEPSKQRSRQLQALYKAGMAQEAQNPTEVPDPATIGPAPRTILMAADEPEGSATGCEEAKKATDGFDAT